MSEESTRIALLEQHRIDMSNTINEIKSEQKEFKHETKIELEKINQKIDKTNESLQVLFNRINLWVGGAVVLMWIGQVLINHFIDKL